MKISQRITLELTEEEAREFCQEITNSGLDMKQAGRIRDYLTDCGLGARIQHVRRGKRVSVMDSGSHELFTGHLANIGPPWVGWHRVIPDSPFIDLPPKFKVIETKEGKDA